MSYLVLARKWRPRQFSEVVAQDHVTRTLENAITQNRLASAYLFAGPRGVGKTTMARLLAKAINCEQGPTVTPCDACSICIEIADGRSLDVLEIDGASNRGIDEVRNLRENARYTPAKGKRKIYIIDEVHMLTEPAFNALLKTLEEPPPHVLFIFATTEVHKVPATILSRCQRFDFHRVPLPEIVGQLRNICSKEGIQIDETSLALIAKKAEGSMRDSQSLLDQVIAYCGQQVKADEVAQLFGIIDQEVFFACTDAIAQRQVGKGLALSEQIYTAGYHLGEFLERLSEHLSNILMTRVTNSTGHLFGLDGYLERYKEAATQFSEVDILRYIQMITDTQLKLSRVANPRVLLEMLLLKMIQNSASVNSDPEVTTPVAATKVTPGAHVESRDDGLKKKPQPVINKNGVSAGSPNSAESGIAVIPQIAPAPASGEMKAETKERASRPARGSLFDLAEMPVVKVPVVQAKEAPLPKLTNVADAKAALEKIQQCWLHILEQVKAQRISLGAFLELGVPTSLTDDGTLEVCFDQGSGFQINSVNNQKTFIQEIISRETGYRVRLVCRKDESEALQQARALLQKVASANGTRAVTEEDATSTAVGMAQKGTHTSGAQEQAADLENSPTSSSNSDSPHHQLVMAPAKLNELYQAYPAIKKLVEALDGELI
ncbi:MAG: DNA polymerase III subunit gamma/tau [candidate division KSB1 bacterium]|nr:DNA polymerase III subunit gamma/tau [candidate division KSB1 bacterium]MDZ7302819.1 DNA polymerase III subunit gamma/tau [candidate division KSB1 bacterium]MDZ7311836.1 DNA polymerase III subunit gamma/tau [candidate division KSB1 bacterium]